LAKDFLHQKGIFCKSSQTEISSHSYLDKNTILKKLLKTKTRN